MASIPAPAPRRDLEAHLAMLDEIERNAPEVGDDEPEPDSSILQAFDEHRRGLSSAISTEELRRLRRARR